MSISKRILRFISKGPATAPEVGAILFPTMSLHDSRRRASAHLCNLRTSGKIKVIGKVERDGYRGNRRMSNLYYTT